MWVNEDHASPSLLVACGPVEEERPVGSGEHWSPGFWCEVRPLARTSWDAWCRSPLRNKVGKDLFLDGMMGLEVELKSSKLCCPLGDVARVVGIMEYGPQRIGDHHHNLVGLEVMAELPGRNEYSIKELMRLRIPGFCFVKDLADILDRLLNSFDLASKAGSFTLSWGLAGPQVFWFCPGSRPDPPK
jgi:hypothetical protein